MTLNNFNDISNFLNDNQPDPTLTAQDLSASNQLGQYQHLKDKEGNSFDPRYHKTTLKGEPVIIKKTGTLIRKNGIKRIDNNVSIVSEHDLSASNAPINDSVQSESILDKVFKNDQSNQNGSEKQLPSQDDQKTENFVPRENFSNVVIQDESSDKNAAEAKNTEAEIQACSFLAASMTFQTAQLVFNSEEWQPINSGGVHEFEELQNAYKIYFVAKGVIDIPPGLALVMTIGVISARRINKPITKTKIQKVKEWIVKKWIEIKMRKASGQPKKEE